MRLIPKSRKWQLCFQRKKKKDNYFKNYIKFSPEKQELAILN